MDTLEKIKKAEGRLMSLYQRMDDDAELAKLEPYTLRDSGGTAVPGALSVTMNEPAIFLNAIVSMIQESVWQTAIEGDLKPKVAVTVERFINENLHRADERLMRSGQPKMFPFLANHICLRGWIGARWLSRVEGGSYIPDCMLMDMRYFSFDRGTEGLLWGAYRMKRSAALVEAEYGYVTEQDEVEVIDYWDDKQEEVYINEELVHTQKHPFGEPPYVIASAPAGFMLRDDGYIEQEGESLFCLNRGMYAELNRLVSIDQTLAMKAVMPPYQKKYREDIPADTVTPYPDKIASVVEVMEGEEYELIPRPDINNASRVAHGNISSGLQRGGINDLDLGNVTFPTSAVWISEQTEIRNKLIAPRISALGFFYEELARMMIRQTLVGGISPTVDMVKYGIKTSFRSSDLGDPDEYRVSFRLMSKSAKQEIANISVAAAARGILSRETLLKDILYVEDPEGEIARIDTELAEEAEPALKLFRMAMAMCDEADVETDPDVADQKRLSSMMLSERAATFIKISRAQAQAAEGQLKESTQQKLSPGGVQKPPGQTPSPVPLVPQPDSPKKDWENGKNWGRPAGGRPPKVPFSMEEGGG